MSLYLLFQSMANKRAAIIAHAFLTDRDTPLQVSFVCTIVLHAGWFIALVL